jgi:long-chain acyl-CoA synthetase
MTNEGAAQATFAALLNGNAQARGGAPAIREKWRGIWRTTSWGALLDESEALAAGLSERGIASGDRIAFIGETRPRLIMGIAAAHRLGAVAVPLFPDADGAEIARQLRSVGAVAAFAEGQQQVDAILELLPECPTVHTLVYDDNRGLGHYAQTVLADHETLVGRGLAMTAAEREQAAAGTQAVGVNDPAFIFFTSGAGGAQKPVVFSHGALISRARAVMKADGLSEKDTTLACFAPGWIVQAMFAYVQPMVSGHCVCCPESPETLLDDMREIAPTYVLTTPRMLDAITSQVSLRMEETGGVNLQLYRRALALADRTARLRLEGSGSGLADRLSLPFYNALIYAPLRDALGMSRLRSAYCTGDRLDPAVLEFFRELGINLKQLYGTTETASFVSIHRDGVARKETVGLPLEDLEVRIAASGEVLVRGVGLMSGYLTDNGIDPARDEDGWLATGDVGEIDADGRLRLHDRVDSLGHLADGTPFAPRPIESKLRVSPYVREAVVFGDGLTAVCALIDINTTAVGKWADGHEIPYLGHADLSAQDAVNGLIAEWIAEVNAELADDPKTARLQVRRFLLLPEELSPEDGMLTRTGKLRRPAITERLAPLIEALHAGHSTVTLDRAATAHGAALTGALKIREAHVVSPPRDSRRAA